MQLLGIEQWVPRSVVSPVPRRAPAPAVRVRREVAVAPATVPVALSAPASRSIAPRPDPRVAQAPADRATVRASPVQGPRLTLQADLHACGTVLAVLEQSVRSAHDMDTAINKALKHRAFVTGFVFARQDNDFIFAFDLAHVCLLYSSLVRLLFQGQFATALQVRAK